MRGTDKRAGKLFSYVDLEKRVRKEHPLRPIREMANTALAVLSGDFAALYSGMGRPSIPPEKLLRAMLLQAFYSIRSERQLMEVAGLLKTKLRGLDKVDWAFTAAAYNLVRLPKLLAVSP